MYWLFPNEPLAPVAYTNAGPSWSKWSLFFQLSEAVTNVYSPSGVSSDEAKEPLLKLNSSSIVTKLCSEFLMSVKPEQFN